VGTYCVQQRTEARVDQRTRVRRTKFGLSPSRCV
jgi:hypothetical protein